MWRLIFVRYSFRKKRVRWYADVYCLISEPLNNRIRAYLVYIACELKRLHTITRTCHELASNLLRICREPVDKNVGASIDNSYIINQRTKFFGFAERRVEEAKLHKRWVRLFSLSFYSHALPKFHKSASSTRTYCSCNYGIIGKPIAKSHLTRIVQYPYIHTGEQYTVQGKVIIALLAYCTLAR